MTAMHCSHIGILAAGAYGAGAWISSWHSCVGSWRAHILRHGCIVAICNSRPPQWHISIQGVFLFPIEWNPIRRMFHCESVQCFAYIILRVAGTIGPNSSQQIPASGFCLAHRLLQRGKLQNCNTDVRGKGTQCRLGQLVSISLSHSRVRLLFVV